MSRFSLILSCLALMACSGPDEGPTGAPEMPRFAEEELGKGRGIWMGTCRNCHLLGVSGAPAVNDYPAWQSRIEKGQPALYQSALSGINGSDGQFRMPPRGGNPQLNDEQIRLAVDYMVASVKQLAGQ
jgi:cytochrome c5